MSDAKAIRLAPIASADAERLVRRLHYSGKVVNNSFLHFGVFLGEQLEGAISIGPSMDKGKLIGLVRDTAWNGFAEINRMAFSERLPRNSESRAIAIALRLIRKRYPHLQWLVSFADATCCGDGTIYRASGAVLTSILPNKTIYVMPTGDRVANLVLTADWDTPLVQDIARRMGVPHRFRRLSEWGRLGAYRAPGFQLRYVYFLNASARARLTVPEIPFARIGELGAAMYLGKARQAGDGRAPPGTATGQHRSPRSNRPAA